jgi:uncharacterized protein (DUF1684 family)
VLLLAGLVALGSPDLIAQAPPALRQERIEWEQWLRSAPTSPFAAIAQAPVGRGLTLGPGDADIPLTGVPATRVTEAGQVVYVESEGRRRAVARNRSLPLATYTMRFVGPPGRTVLAVYGPPRDVRSPAYFDYQGSVVFTLPLRPLDRPESRRLLTLEGTEVDADRAGTIAVPLGPSATPLTVYRIPDPETGESDLMLYFQDETNGHGSYPAGRFLTLLPAGDGRYLVDFNRARNPFCAYSSVYPCPAPWPGNRLGASVAAGERYATTARATERG